MTTTGHTARAARLVGIALVATAAAGSASAGSASAGSRLLDYSCEYDVGESHGVAPATASFGSGIGEGVVITLGETVVLDPYTGTITLPDQVTALLREADVTVIEGDGLNFTVFPEDGTYESPRTVEIRYAATKVLDDGPVTVLVDGVAGGATPDTPGLKTWSAGAFVLDIDTDVQGVVAGMMCELVDRGDVSIASFVVTAPATPTPTTPPPASATPVRPVVVQTDFADEGRGAVPPALGVGALLTLVAGAVEVRRRARRIPVRRH